LLIEEETSDDVKKWSVSWGATLVFDGELLFLYRSKLSKLNFVTNWILAKVNQPFNKTKVKESILKKG